MEQILLTAEQQRERCAEKLKALVSYLSPQDRDEAQELFQKTERTIIRYLQGQVANVDFGVKLYEFLKSKVDERNKILA